MSDDELPFLPVAKPDIGSLERDYVLRAIDSGWVSSVGPFVSQFEDEFAEYIGTDYAISISNGTDALFIALKALGIGFGDEVIVPALTFVAVASAVIRTGATPVFADVDARNWCIDPDAVELAISEETKAVIAVHSYGHPADMERLLSIAAANQLLLIEDCAEAHGARVMGSVVGSIGHVGCFSFYGNKVMTTGEGGMITTSSGDLNERCRYLKDHAMDKGRTYFHSEIGFNCRMTNLQAALGCAQLRRLPDFLEKRRRVLGWYKDAIGPCDWIKLNPRSNWADPVIWMVSAEFVNRPSGWRDCCISQLRELGIDSRPFFVTLSDLPPYQRFRTVGKRGPALPESKRLSEQGINLPTSSSMSEADVQRVVSAVKACTPCGA